MKTLAVSMLVLLALSMVMPLAFAAEEKPLDPPPKAIPSDGPQFGVLLCITIVSIAVALVAFLIKVVLPIIVLLPFPFNLLLAFLTALIIIFAVVVTVTTIIECTWYILS